MAPPKKYPRSVRRRGCRRTLPRAYVDVAAAAGPSYWSDAVEVAWGCQSAYEVVCQVGKGKYGEVFEAVDLRSGARCAVKIMRPVKEHRLLREIKILGHVRGGANIIDLVEVVRDPDTKTPTFVFEYVAAESFKQLQAVLTDGDIRCYLFQLLRALDHCHSKGIMHRDVKPGNVLIDHRRRLLRLIDWGLADFYHPGREYPVRVATRFYKGPELLVDLRDYDYSLDMWGAGCILAALIFKRAVFFRGEEEFDQLAKIAKVLGTDDLYAYTDKYGITLDPRLVAACGIRPRQPWAKFTDAGNRHLCSPEAFDLLSHLLCYDHVERFTAREAMAHPYFDPVRDSVGAHS